MTDQNGVERSRTELTATKRLRAMLDERGIEWRRPPHYSSESKDNETIFRVNGFEWYAYDEGNGYLSLRTCKLLVTPEQAIAATVGDKPKADITRLHATVNAAITGIVRNARCFSDYGTATEHINDNGDVTAIHECVKRAATVGAGTLTAEQVRECSKGVYFEGYSDGATHRVNGIEETDWQAIADKLNATLGAGTCKLAIEKRRRHGPWIYHFGCGYNFWQPTDCPMPILKHCPNCGRKVIGTKEESE